MKIFLHIGTEKTGSSYLQTTLARNRQDLLLSGIHYPEAGKRENDMFQGRISPGNAVELTRMLENADYKNVFNFFNELYHRASELKCNAVLLSNENLVRVLSVQSNVDLLFQVAKQIGFKDFKFILFLRNPVDQAIAD